MRWRDVCAVACLLALTQEAGCFIHNNCGSCPQKLDLVANCLQANSCTINGSVNACTAPTCPLFVLPQNDVIGLPLDRSIAARNDVDFVAYGADMNFALVMFDDQPATGCANKGGFELLCSDIPSTVRVVSFSYSKGKATDFRATMMDAECEASLPPCQD